MIVGGGGVRGLTIRRQDRLRPEGKTRADRGEAKLQVAGSPPEMEWKLERTARRRVRTEEEMMWVSDVLLFPRGFSSKALGPRCSTKL